jgi:hypothetical protein
LNVVSIDGGAEAEAMEAAMVEGVGGDGTGEMSLLEEFEARRLASEAKERGEDEDGDDESRDDAESSKED